MRPNSISATALHVADQCLARYAAEHVYRSKGPGNQAANLGTAVHGGLELFIKACHIEKTHEPTWSFLQDCFKMSYLATFGGTEYGEGFDAGIEMLQRWFMRTDFTGVNVISAEVKNNFIIPTSIGPIPFNYIWDRFDGLPDDVYRVVDYKSSVWAVRPEDLKKKVQARCYGLAAAIQLKQQQIDYKKIKVEFDMLRHDAVGIVYTREEIAATWKFIKSTLEEKIIPTDPAHAPETLNPECRFCVRKSVCKALQTNISVGGIFGLPLEQAIDRRAALQFQIAGINASIKELDELIMEEAKTADVLEFESDMYRAYLAPGRSNRKVDADRVEMVVGPEIFEEYGAKQMAVGQWERLCKDKRLTPEQVKRIRTLVSKPPGEIGVKIEAKSSFPDEL